MNYSELVTAIEAAAPTGLESIRWGYDENFNQGQLTFPACNIFIPESTHTYGDSKVTAFYSITFLMADIYTDTDRATTTVHQKINQMDELANLFINNIVSNDNTSPTLQSGTTIKTVRYKDITDNDWRVGVSKEFTLKLVDCP